MASRKKEESEKAIRLCGKQCVICGWNSKSIRGFSLVEGAHVKPVVELDSDCFDDIIALCPNHHAEFDAYNFYIDPKTMSIIHTDKTSIYHGKQVDIPYVRKEYLAYRQYLFQKELDSCLVAQGK